MRPVAIAVSVAIALALGACRTTPDAVSLAPPVTAVAHVDADAVAYANANLNAVLWVQSSAEYDAAALAAYHAAAARLDAALADKSWDALAPGERANPDAISTLPPAVILDVDETVLDNSPYQARLVRDGGAYDEATWAAWVEERSARPVPGVLDFARAATARGVTLVYLSNRAEHLQDATLDNLRAVGLPVAGESVFLGLGTVVEGCEQAGSEKDCRRQLAGRQYRVLMQFGDQLGDFVAVEANTPAARQALVDRHAGWFGDRWWMLPNPTYGGWEPAVFDNDWRLPLEARRAAKRAALDTGGR